MSEPLLALSVKQPWAALLVAGVKAVEVRTWRTSRRGPVLIHAGKVPDDRPEGWTYVTPELEALAGLRGGFVGAADLEACRKYETAEAFAADCDQHLNATEWWVAAGLYGFVFRRPRPIAYHPYPGQTLFFTVEGFTLS